jgi:hypothetical protein
MFCIYWRHVLHLLAACSAFILLRLGCRKGIFEQDSELSDLLKEWNGLPCSISQISKKHPTPCELYD